MKGIQILTVGIFVLFYLAEIEAHGHLSFPTIRGTKRQDESNAPVAYPLAEDFVCRNDGPLDPAKYTTLTAGKSANMSWALEAPHPGDCFAYLSYDANLPDTQKKWFKVAQWNDCNMLNLQMLQFTVPSYLPSCEHCVLRWEWYALHLRDINIVEWYSQCSDVKIVGSSNGQLPTPQVTIPGHLPMAPKFYRSEFKNPDLVLFTGPPMASIGGAAYSCSSAYDSTCTVAPPDPNPCHISYQRCVSQTQYQGCGVGYNSTEWGPAQPCQTGLVCAPHPDGMHIMCTNPPASGNTPSPAPATTGKPSVTTGQTAPAQVTTGKVSTGKITTGKPSVSTGKPLVTTGQASVTTGQQSVTTGVKPQVSSTTGPQEMCYLPGTPNINGKINSNPPTCGINSNKARCADGQCCSKYGYCGPIKNANGQYVEGGKVVSEEYAINLYCNNTKADYRKVPCSSVVTGVPETQSNNLEEESFASSAVTIYTNQLLAFASLLLTFALLF